MTTRGGDKTAELRARPGGRGWLLLTPRVVWLRAFVVATAVILVICSFAERDELGRVVYTFTLENYRRVFDPVYLGVFVRSVGFAAATTVICVVLGFPVAWWIARSPEKWRH